jgi:hypothetical protein
METAFMKLLLVMGTAGLFLLLGSAADAQDRPESDAKPEAKKSDAKPEAKRSEAKPEAKRSEAKPEAKPEAKSEAKPAAKPKSNSEGKPEAKSEAKSEGKPARQEEKSGGKQEQQKTEQSRNDGGKSGGGAHGRISEAHYSASFGSEHHFHVKQGDYNNHRFNYGGYSFGFIDAWPAGWYYTDDVYVVYEDGEYYMYDVVHPGIHISVNII